MGLKLDSAAFDVLQQSYTRHEQSLDLFISSLQLILMSHYTHPFSIFSYSDMLGEEQAAIKLLKSRKSLAFVSALQSSILSSIERRPDFPAALEVLGGEELGSNSKLAPENMLFFVAQCRLNFDDHHARFKIALRILRRVILEVRAHSGEIKGSVSYLLGAALSGRVVKEEVKMVVNKIRCVLFLLPRSPMLLRRDWHLVMVLRNDAMARQASLDRLERTIDAILDVLEKLPNALQRPPTTALSRQVTSWKAFLTGLANNNSINKTPSPAKQQASPQKAASSLISPTKNAAFTLPPVHQVPPEVVAVAEEMGDVLEAYFM